MIIWPSGDQVQLEQPQTLQAAFKLHVEKHGSEVWKDRLEVKAWRIQDTVEEIREGQTKGHSNPSLLWFEEMTLCQERFRSRDLPFRDRCSDFCPAKIPPSLDPLKNKLTSEELMTWPLVNSYNYWSYTYFSEDLSRETDLQIRDKSFAQDSVWQRWSLDARSITSKPPRLKNLIILKWLETGFVWKSRGSSDNLSIFQRLDLGFV